MPDRPGFAGGSGTVPVHRRASTRGLGARRSGAGTHSRARDHVPGSVAAVAFLPAATGLPAWSGDAGAGVWSGGAAVVAWWDGARAAVAWSGDALASADASSPTRARRASPRGRARTAQRGAFEFPWRGFSLPSEKTSEIGSGAFSSSELSPALDCRHLQCLVPLRGPAQTPLLHWLFRMHGAPEGCTRAGPLRQIPPWQ